MANDAGVMLNMASRLGTARAEAVRLLAAAAEDAGVWMHNLSTGARALVSHEDTLTRLITEGWVHLEEGLHLTPAPASASAPEAAAPADAPAEPLQAAPAASEAEPEAPTEPAPKGKKA